MELFRSFSSGKQAPITGGTDSPGTAARGHGASAAVPCAAAGGGGAGQSGRVCSPASICRQLCCSACTLVESAAISPSRARSSDSLAAGSCSCGEDGGGGSAAAAGGAGGSARGRGSPGRRSRSSASRRPSHGRGPAAPAAPAPSPRPAGRSPSARPGPGPASPRPGSAYRLAQPMLPLQVPEGVLGAVRPVLLPQVPQQDGGGGASCGTARWSPRPPGTAKGGRQPPGPRSLTHRPPRGPHGLCSSSASVRPAPLPTGGADALPARRPLPANRGEGREEGSHWPRASPRSHAPRRRGAAGAVGGARPGPAAARRSARPGGARRARAGTGWSAVGRSGGQRTPGQRAGPDQGLRTPGLDGNRS